MKLTKQVLKGGVPAGYGLPGCDMDKVAEETQRNPSWLHFGAGNIFRAFPARICQELLNAGEWDRGIVVCESYDEELIQKAYRPYDNLSIAVTLKSDKSVDKMLVASIVESLTSGDRERLEQLFTAPSLQIASFTITEKGYAVKGVDGQILPYIKADLEAGPQGAKSLMAIVAALCYKRYQAGAAPLALVSMDNCARNGDLLRASVTYIAGQWAEKGFVDKAFLDYLADEGKITFPISMIDKITPHPAPEVQKQLEEDGWEDMQIIRTGKNTVSAAFVNAEETEYLVVEEKFPNGRPPLEKGGVIFTDRETVDNVEKMKVGSCLNPLHTILSVFGCILNYRLISEMMRDTAIVNLIKQAGYVESMPYVPDPGIIRPKDFIDTVIQKRFPNPYILDTPQRIAADTSQKISVRFGGTMKVMEERGADFSALKAIPFFIAGWLRYLMAMDDAGNKMQLQPDPMLEQLQQIMSAVTLGDTGIPDDAIRPVLSNRGIFVIDLYKYGLDKKIKDYLLEMVAGPGAVRAALDRHFS